MRSRDWTTEADAITACTHDMVSLFRARPFDNANGMAVDTALYLYCWVQRVRDLARAPAASFRQPRSGFRTIVLPGADEDRALLLAG